MCGKRFIFLNISRSRESGSSDAQKIDENLAKFRARRSVFEGIIACREFRTGRGRGGG